MKKSKSNSTLFKSYILEHKANPGKVAALFQLYDVYKFEYKAHMVSYWSLFLKNQINDNKFNHFGSTKHIKTQLNSALLQGLIAQTCASLNNYVANIVTKFNQFISNSSIKDKDLLHKLISINSQHAWLNTSVS